LSYRSLKRKRSQNGGSTSKDEDGFVWGWDWQLKLRQFAELSSAEACLYTGPSSQVRAYSHINIQQLHLHTSETERNLMTQDLAAGIQLPAESLQYGILQAIWEVSVGSSNKVVIEVEVFLHSSPDKGF